MTETTQEHAVDHASTAPADVSLDTSTTPGPGGDTSPANGSTGNGPEQRDNGTEQRDNGTAQHGLTAHSHGAGADVPASSRAERRTSFALEDFPMPSGREEEWRFTPLDHLGRVLRAEGQDDEALTVSVAGPAEVTVGSLAAGEAPRGVAGEPADRAAAVAHTGTAKAQHVRVPDDAQLAEPVRVTVVGQSGTHGTGVLVVEAGRFSQATVVIDHTGSGEHAANVEVVAGEGAQLTIVSLQRWDDDAVHLAQHDVLVHRDAHVKHVAVSLGGKVVRFNANVRYDGPGGEATLLGVYFADAGQHLEHRSFVDHEAPHCTSLVTYKGALQGDTARTVWVGDVLIRAGADATETYELNRNLVLTDGARADSVPNLEIETGQIKGAGHASATGRFDDLQLFYLQARGIPEAEARRLVVRGFFADVIQQIGVADVQELLMEAIEHELSDAMAAGAAV